MSDMATASVAELERHIAVRLVKRYVSVESNRELREGLQLPADVSITRLCSAMGHLITQGKVRRSHLRSGTLAGNPGPVVYWWAAAMTPHCVIEDRRDAGEQLVYR